MTGQRVSGHRCVVLPTNPYKQGWDLIVLIILGLSAIIVPWRVAFFTEAEELTSFTAWSLTELTMDCLLLVDVGLSFVSAYEHDGIVETDLSTISWTYFRTWFLLDLAASFPISLAFPVVGQNLRGVRLLRLPRMLKLLKVLRLLRVMRVLRASRYARSIQRYVNLNPAALRLLVFIGAFMLFAHMVACLWFLVADLEDFSPDTWVVRYGILDSEISVQYVASLYYSTTLLSTTGLGDIVPLAPSEQIYTICLEVAGVTVISYLTSTVTGLIGSFDARARRRRLKFEEVERFMGAKRLSPQLRGTIRDYFEMILASKSTSAVDEAKLLGELSGPLQTAVVFEVHHALIERFGFFKGKQAEFVRDVLRAATPLTIKHDREIVREGMTGDALYLLTQGRVNFESLQGIVYMQLPSGSVFGAISLLCTGRNIFSVRSVGFVEAYTLARRDVERILEDYPDVEAELLALALARLRRVEIVRGRTRDERRRAAPTAFSEAAEAATDAAVTRALAEPGRLPLSEAAAERRAHRSSTPGTRAGRRAQSSREDLAAGLEAGTAQRVAILRHMAETRTFRRLSSSGIGAAASAGAGDSKLAAADAAVARAVQGGDAPLVLEEGGADGPAPTGGASAPSAATAARRAPPAEGATPGAAARAPSPVAGGGGGGAGAEAVQSPEPVTAPRSGKRRAARASAFFPSSLPPLLDEQTKQDSLRGKSMSGTAMRAPMRQQSSSGAVRASPTSFRTDMSRSKEMELSRQTDSLIHSTMGTVDRAVRRKERLVSRIAVERERRQFTSRPIAAPSTPSRETGRAAHGFVPSRGSSHRLRAAARGLRAKLGARREELRQVAALTAASSARWDAHVEGQPDAGPSPMSASGRDEAIVPLSGRPSSESSPTHALEVAPARPAATSEATAAALQEMTATMRGVAASIAGLQAEQEAIVDLLIAVLADDEEA